MTKVLFQDEMLFMTPPLAFANCPNRPGDVCSCTLLDLSKVARFTFFSIIQKGNKVTSLPDVC